MTDNPDSEPAAQPEASPPLVVIVRLCCNSGIHAALVAIYYLLPLDHFATWVASPILAIGLLVLIGLAAFQVRWIVVSRLPPALRGVEALATSIPLFLLLIRSAPSCLAASTASRPTAPSSTTVTVLPGPDVGVDCTEPAGAENIGGSQQAGIRSRSG